MALDGMIDNASFDHSGAWLPVHSVCPRSHLQLVQGFLDQSAHQNSVGEVDIVALEVADDSE